MDQVEWVLEEYATRYFDFTVKHFHEEIAKRGFVYSYAWTKAVLYRSGLVRPKRRLGPRREKRVQDPSQRLRSRMRGSQTGRFSATTRRGLSYASG